MCLSDSGVAFPPRHSSVLGGTVFFLGNFGRSIHRLAALFCTSFQMSSDFSSRLIIFRVLMGFFEIFWASVAHKFLACNDVLQLSLCLRERTTSLNPKNTHIFASDSVHHTSWIRAFVFLFLHLCKHQSHSSFSF